MTKRKSEAGKTAIMLFAALLGMMFLISCKEKKPEKTHAGTILLRAYSDALKAVASGLSVAADTMEDELQETFQESFSESMESLSDELSQTAEDLKSTLGEYEDGIAAAGAAFRETLHALSAISAMAIPLDKYKNRWEEWKIKESRREEEDRKKIEEFFIDYEYFVLKAERTSSKTALQKMTGLGAKLSAQVFRLQTSPAWTAADSSRYSRLYSRALRAMKK